MSDASRRNRRLPAGRLTAAALSLLALLALALPAAAIDPDDLLPVDEAFALSARATAADRIALDWRIADGYYLYRHRIAVSSDAGFDAQALQLPRGQAHQDEFFGKVETYRGQLRAILPGQARAATTTLTVKYQGCADLGICYPPQTRRVTVALPAAERAPATDAAAGTADRQTRADAPVVDFGGATGVAPTNPLQGAGGIEGTDPLPLPPAQAFGFEAIAGDGNTLLLRFTPAPGYYLYRDNTTLTLDTEAITLGQPRWPQGTAHRDEHFGDVIVYFQQIDVPVPLQRRRAEPAAVELTARFQGCQTGGICYPPMTRTVEVALPAGRADASADTVVAPSLLGADDPEASRFPDVGGQERPSVPGAEAQEQPSKLGSTGGIEGADDTDVAAAPRQAEDSRLAAALAGVDRWGALLSFFGFGLLLAFTPCVLPMIPILSGLIAGHGPGLSVGRAFCLSLVYVVANALVFTVAGVVAGLLGANLQVAFQIPWIISLFALLFVALALSSFGLYELQMPGALRSRLGALSDRQRGGSWAGVAAMGALSALIVGPCVAPPLAAAVLYIGQTQDPAFGGAALFLLAMGMGVPLLAFGVAAGRGLPTSGPWMVAVQRAFGFVFLGLAVWMLGRILPGPATLALWGALGLGAAVMLALTTGRSRLRDGVRALGWTAAALLGLAGGAQVLGALAGGSDPLQPLAGLRDSENTVRELPFRRIKSPADLDREIAAARAAGKPLLLDFYADWCVACKEMEKYTFPQPVVHEALAGFVLLKADVTANDAIDQALMQRLGIIGPPATLFYVDGRERRGLRLYGFEPAEAFARRAASVRAGAASGTDTGTKP